MFLVAPPFFATSASAPSLTTKSFLSGAAVGYLRPGGVVANVYGESGGSLSGALLTGTTTDALLQQAGGGTMILYFVGDVVAALTGYTGLKINSTVCAISSPASYGDNVPGLTGIEFDGSAIPMTALTTYTVQLV